MMSGLRRRSSRRKKTTTTTMMMTHKMPWSRMWAWWAVFRRRPTPLHRQKKRLKRQEDNSELLRQLALQQNQQNQDAQKGC
ncbi:hypothetical protein M5D96_013408 [Drosophila gunungcola]|uniref:Uncharacterized protein n=1 Tax=Drosophila gunungcola TaxID=103775 RepID=A0A9P9YC64_9MUSC|nr:hypothetical protein M5D96_013408 [Drosophila gunungcola]